MKTKTNTVKKMLQALFVVLSFFFAPECTFAQPVAFPSTPDIPARNCAEAFNTAMINYGTTTSSFNTNVVFGIAWESGAPIYVHDVATGVTATCPVPPTRLGDIPDVAIGNAATLGDFVMAVAYCHHPTSSASEIEVDFYDITGAGTPGLAVAYNSSRIITAGMPYFHNAVHLDIIAEHPSIFTNLPICKKFALTFEDQSTGLIFVTNGDVSTYTLNPLAIASPTPGSQPDVAGIQREVPAGSSVIHDMALITYVDMITGDLVYTEFDITTPGPWTVSHMDIATGTSFAVPRIDADDDWTTNAVPSTSVKYQIAVQATSGGISDIHTCNNVLGPASFFNCTAAMVVPGYTAPYNHYSPIAVKSGPGTYGMFQWSNILPGVGFANKSGTFLEPIDNSSPATMAPHPYFWVNSAAGTPVHSGQIYTWNGTWSISASSTCNFNFAASSLNIYAWAETNAFLPPITKYKLSSTAFAFKPGNATSVTGTIQGADVKIFPNPATNELIVSNAAGAQNQTKYHIMDATGYEALKGEIHSSNEHIDISKLAAGCYIINMNDGNELNLNIKFVKE